MYLKNLTKEKLKKAFPLLAAVTLIQVVCYYLPSILPPGKQLFIRLPLDDKIPFCNFFIVFYVIAYAAWVIQWLFYAAEGEPILTKYVRAEIMGKVVSLIIFILLPVTTVRPADTGSGVFGWITALIYSLDSPTRLFPSMHCLLTWLWFRAVLEAKDMTRGVKVFTGVLTVLICASTLYVKQHLFLDVPGGILLAELCLFISGRLPLKHEDTPGGKE